jgi:Gpi18-like mannosyltransferase
MVLLFFLWSTTYLEVNIKRTTNSTADGFFPFDYIYNDMDHITFSESEITIEALNNTWPTVQVYSGSDAFNWSFSVTPLEAIGDCQPIKTLIDWKAGSFILWADSTFGWFYNYHPNYENSTQYPINWERNPTLTIDCKYNIEIEFKALPESIILNFAISNSTWSSQKITLPQIPLETDIRFDEVAIYLQAFAYDDTQVYSKAVYANSQLSFANSVEQNPFSIWLLLILSAVTTIITIITIIVKSRLSSVIQSLFQRGRNFLHALNAENLKASLKISAKTTRSVILIFVFFAGLRLVLAFATNSHLFDSTLLTIWHDLIRTNGVFSIYSLPSVLPPFLGLSIGFPYPPIIAYIISLFPYLPPQQNLAEFILKLPPIIGDLLLGLVVFLAVKSREGLSVAIPALFLSLLNFVDSSIWGQYDSIVALFMVLAVWLVATKKVELGWVFAALAVSTKQTALVFLPALLLLSIKQKSLSRLIYGLLVFFAVTFFVWFPFLVNGFSFDFALNTTGFGLWSSGGGMDPLLPRGGGGTSLWAFNIWPLITLKTADLRTGIIGGVKDTAPQFFALNYMQLGLILFLIAYSFIAIRIWKSSKPSDYMLNFGLLMFAFFMLPTRIHERYLIFALSFLPFAYKKSKVILGSYLVLLSTFWLNLEYALLTGAPNQVYEANLVFSETGLLIIILTNIVVFLLLFIKTSHIRIRITYQSEETQDL